MSGKFALSSPLGDAYSHVDMTCRVDGHSASKAVNLVAIELARHTGVVSGFTRALEKNGTVVRIKFRDGVTFKQKSEFVKAFVANMNDLDNSAYCPAAMDYNTVFYAGYASIDKD